MDKEFQLIVDVVNGIDAELFEVNKAIHDHPELCYQEFVAHDAITKFLRTRDLHPLCHSYGLQTSFVSEYGSGGRLVTFCAEYDALEGIGHGCGHNLIATSAIAAFIGVASALKQTGTPGRVRLLGCPAEEGGGGKIKLIDAGAFSDVDAALMLHPTPPLTDDQKHFSGISYGTCMACCQFTVTFKGKSAHAGAYPWLGINALDAATLAYNAVSMLRQQSMPSNRINVSFGDTGSSPNIIAETSTMHAAARAATLKEMASLKERLYKCFQGAAIATGCEYTINEKMKPYADLRPNESLCSNFAKEMTKFGQEYYCDLKKKDAGGYGTDMGNVSYECPSFHGNFVIPALPGENIHGPGFTRASGTLEAHQMALQAAKGMAATGWRVLADEAFATQVREDFEADRLKRSE